MIEQKDDIICMGTCPPYPNPKNMANTPDNNGLLIAFLTDGMLNMTWMDRVQNEIPAGIPSGIFWKTAWVKGKNYREKGGYAKARTELVEKAMELKAKWIFMVDTDVLPSPDVITKMMAHKKDIVTGIYYMKSQPVQPILYKKLGDGPYWDFPIDELFEVEAVGSGCILINMKVFEAMKKAGIPYYQENWEYTKPDGTKVQVRVGEDYWFCYQAKNLGFTTYCDSSLLCDHIDYNTGAIFPGEEEVKRIRDLSLAKHKEGRAILKNEGELFKLPDPTKKTIVFNNAVGSEISGDELSKRAVGGAETGVIHIAKHLAKLNFNVIVFGNVSKPGDYDGVRYLNVSDGEFLKKFKTDLLVVVRNTQVIANFNFKEMYDIDKIALWVHDVVDSPAFTYLKEAAPFIDKIITLSEWHRETIKDLFPNIPEDKFVIIRNAVTDGLFKPKLSKDFPPPKMVYSSTPFRGLDVLLEVFPEIKRQVPDAELHVYSSLKVYGGEYVGTDNNFKHLYDLAKNTDGVFYHGSVLQEELSDAVRTSRLWGYPNHYPETSCISVMESVQAGVPMIATRLAALPETLPKGCGVLLHPPSTDLRYKEDFVKEAVSILLDPHKYLAMRNECLRYNFSWGDRAKEWKQLFFPDEKLTKPSPELNAKIEERLKEREEHKLIQARAKENALEYEHPKGSETIDNPLAKDTEELKHKTEVETYKARHGGNLNTPEYWDNQYKFEHQKGLDQRTDMERFVMITDAINDGESVCDFGCGLGHFLIHLNKVKPNCILYGVDISEYALGVCKTQLPAAYFNTELETSTSCMPKFDVITNQHVIEHTDYPEKMIQLMQNHLKKEGLLILVVPINDDEWIEHQKIYQISDVINLLNKFDCTYKLEHRVKTLRKKKSGSEVEELVAFIRFR